MTHEPESADRDLPVEPPPYLEERIVAALRAEGLLAHDAPVAHRGDAGRPGRRAAAPFLRSWPLAAAASLALFAAGFAAGQFTGSRSTAVALIAAREADATATAALVQQAGSAYVHALAALADRSERVPGTAASDQGEAAALAAFTAAAAELARLDPENETAHQVLTLLTSAAEGGEPSASSRQTLWF